MRCPSCGSDNPDNQKFCGNCGNSLILEMEGEKKNVTVLFADISNFSTISEKLDHEEVQKLLNTVFDVITNASERYGGTIDKFIGDEDMLNVYKGKLREWVDIILKGINGENLKAKFLLDKDIKQYT